MRKIGRQTQPAHHAAARTGAYGWHADAWLTNCCRRVRLHVAIEFPFIPRILLISKSYYRSCMQVKDASARNDDAAVVTDVYRVAFEEQLERNKELLRRLGDLTLTPPHMQDT